MSLVRVLGFSLFVLLGFALFSNMLPQLKSNPPPVEAAAPVGKLDTAGMIAWGEKLFAGKGTCTLCHNNLGRAPDLLKLELGTVLPKRIADSRYEGAAKGKTGAQAIEIYLRESLIKPSAYVVSGFGKKGTADKVSPMRPADKPPVGFNENEVNAVIAFLQSKAGVEVTVKLPEPGVGKPAKKDGDGDGDGDENETKPAKTAEGAINKFACSGCHDLFDSEADAGPKLNGAGKRLGRAGIRKAILDPDADIAKGFEKGQMPKDYAAKMRVSELKLIIDYLMTLKPK